MKKRQAKYLGFTLVELTLSVLIIWLIMPSMFALYNFIIKSNKEILARQNTIQQWYEFFERLNILMQDYTVDYEEYYNRQMVGCVKEENGALYQGSNFQRNVDENWYCTEFTAYGNDNNYYNTSNPRSKYQDIYYCSSESMSLWFGNRVVKWLDCGRKYGRQSYWQYAALFKDVHSWTWIIIWSEDDEEKWYLLNESVDAIEKANNIQELYLISHDGKNRLYFRRKLVKPDENTPEQDKKYKQYKIQILRLRWFDAWRMHSFDSVPGEILKNDWLYDGIIDTWACDTAMWFEPPEAHKTKSVWWAYSGYFLPQYPDDCWVDLTYWSANIFAWNISISPSWDPDLYWAKPGHQINPYMKIMTINGVYFPAISNNSTIIQSIREFKVPLETTINMKDFYRWYSQ